MSPPALVELRAGGLSATLDGADLRDIRWGSLDVASRIQVTVRDVGWGTVPLTIRSCSIERSEDGFRVNLSAVHDDGRVAFGWDGTIEGMPDGALTFSIDGAAERGFEYRRIGICVLHPWRTSVGCTYRATTPTGQVHGTFPHEIAPQLLEGGQYLPMIEAFSGLEVAYPGFRVGFAYEGELFELEDQRNWTDASFKTYPTPLARSEPRWLRPRERVGQRVEMRVEGPPPPSSPLDEVTTVRIGGPTGRRMPSIGLVAPGDPTLRPAHLRVEVDLAKDHLAELETGVSIGVPLEVALLVEGEATKVERLAPLLRSAPLARVLIHRSDGATTPRELVRSVRERLGEILERVPVVGGTSDHFSELNRHPPDGAAVDAIAFSISPTVHASDERSMLETLEIQGQVVRRARELAGGTPIVVSPVRLGAHVGTPFADAWTVGSLAALTAARASSLTYERAAPALGHATQLREAALKEVAVSRPERVAVLAAGAATILANLTPSPQRLRIEGKEQPALAPYEVRIR